jgi:hypothetical protein
MSRTRWTWVVVGGIATLLVVAGVDALLSSENGTSAPTTTDIKTSPSAEQEIERTGNRWARLFAGGDRQLAAPGTCRYMTQPSCERISCERVGRETIKNCTRPSWEFRRSFAGAVVEETVVRGHRAAARFSNGETVLLSEIGISGSWRIHKVGGNAGRKFFANEPS